MVYQKLKNNLTNPFPLPLLFKRWGKNWNGAYLCKAISLAQIRMLNAVAACKKNILFMNNNLSINKLFGKLYFFTLPISARVITWDDWELTYWDYDKKEFFSISDFFPCLQRGTIKSEFVRHIIVEKIKLPNEKE